MRSVCRRCAALVIAAVVAMGCGGAARPVGSPGARGSAFAPPAAASPTAAVPTTPVTSAQGILDLARVAYGAPGAIAVVRHDDDRLFLASGSADTDGTPITDTTRFRIASITKPIVAALVLDSVERGEVRLDDVVGEVLPGVIRPEPPVTVRQLLDHTSGIFDESNGVPSRAALEADIAQLSDPALRAEATKDLDAILAGSQVIASDRVIVALSETHDRLFEPGARFGYSNTNYQLAAMVLERVTGKPLGDLLRDRLVEPLGLGRTSIAPPDTADPELHGYVTSADGSLADITDDLGWFGNGGNGGVIATPDDLLTTLQAIVGGDYLSGDLTDAMLTPSTGTYGLGIGSYDFPCGTYYGHQGAVNGTVSIAVASRDGGDGIVIAFNLRSATDPDLVTLAQALLCPTRDTLGGG